MFLVVVNHSGCNIHSYEILQPVVLSNDACRMRKGRAGCDIRGQHVNILNVSKCTVGFTASPTEGAGLVGGGRGSLDLEGSW